MFLVRPTDTALRAVTRCRDLARSNNDKVIWKMIRWIAKDLRQHVMKLGYEVLGVEDSGEDPIQSAGALRPDLGLMHVRLSGPMDGLEAGAVIEPSLGAAIVYVTSTPVPDRMCYYVPKPFGTSTLASVIAKALDRTQLRSHVESLGPPRASDRR